MLTVQGRIQGGSLGAYESPPSQTNFFEAMVAERGWIWCFGAFRKKTNPSRREWRFYGQRKHSIMKLRTKKGHQIFWARKQTPLMRILHPPLLFIDMLLQCVLTFQRVLFTCIVRSARLDVCLALSSFLIDWLTENHESYVSGYKGRIWKMRNCSYGGVESLGRCKWATVEGFCCNITVW